MADDRRTNTGKSVSETPCAIEVDGTVITIDFENPETSNGVACKRQAVVAQIARAYSFFTTMHHDFKALPCNMISKASARIAF